MYSKIFVPGPKHRALDYSNEVLSSFSTTDSKIIKLKYSNVVKIIIKLEVCYSFYLSLSAVRID